jgi:hypothetical protein
VIEEKIDKEITFTYFEAILIGDECKADASVNKVDFNGRMKS